jgi:hypothetical protein
MYHRSTAIASASAETCNITWAHVLRRNDIVVNVLWLFVTYIGHCACTVCSSVHLICKELLEFNVPPVIHHLFSVVPKHLIF